MLLSPRRIGGEEAISPRLNTIPELDENASFERVSAQSRSNFIAGSLRTLTEECETLRDSYSDIKAKLEAVTREKEALLTQVANYHLALERRDIYFKKVIDYVIAELQHDRDRYEAQISGLQEQLSTIKKERDTASGRSNKTATTSEDDTPVRLRLNSYSNNTFLWDLEEAFLKYMNEDNRFKGILFPVMRKLAELPHPEQLLEQCERVFNEVSQYEKELKRIRLLGSFVEDFVSESKLILSDDEPEDQEPGKCAVQFDIFGEDTSSL